MRTEHEIFQLILSTARLDNRVRAVLLNGSRANPKAKRDPYQDFDIVFLVNDIETYRKEPEWVNIFGERIIMQMPNSMQIDDEDLEAMKNSITYLMLFKDTNRIDLTLRKVKDRHRHPDSLTKVLLDKDLLYPPELQASDRDYHVKLPSEKQFLDCCNEFWWVSTYVMKGLLREEPLYAKDMLEGPVRKMFLRMISWYIGTQTGFSINLGSSYKHLKAHIHPDLWERILATYPDANLQNIRSSHKEMLAIFHKLEVAVAARLGFHYDQQEAQNVKAYLFRMGL